jgi:hypothetical protein
MKDMLSDGRAKKVSMSDIQQKIEQQFSRKLANNVSAAEFGTTKIRWSIGGYSNVRIHSDIFSQFIKASVVDLIKYTLPTQPSGGFVCNDFSTALKGESGIYSYMAWAASQPSDFYEMVLAITLVPGHRINAVWFSDKDDFHYVEPQLDRTWVPDMGKEKDIPLEMIF